MFVLLAAAAALVAPRLLAGEQAGSAREAQSSLEVALDAGARLASSAGQLSADLDALEDLAPRLTYLDAVSPSTGPTVVSIAVTGESFAAAAADGHGTCWAVLHRTAGSGQLSTYLALDVAVCTAAEATARENNVLPPATGTSWSNPWSG